MDILITMILFFGQIIKYNITTMKTKQEYLQELALIAFRMDDKAKRQEEKTKRMQRMASLSRAGQKDSKEFKQLEAEMFALRSVVKQLRRYKMD